ncbi:MAG: hypothetical protein R3F61_16925 [Myxococcota bacterium]
MRALSLLVLVAGCASEPEVALQRITPANGQTDVGRFVPLVVAGDVGHFPADYPLPDLFTVVDLDGGGTIPGTVTYDGERLVFAPDEAWPDDRDYLWTVRDPLDESRRPELEIDPALQGSASFSTRRELRILHAGWSETSELCVLTSQPLLPTDVSQRIHVTLDDLEVDVLASRILEPEALDQTDLENGDNGIGAVCLRLTGPQDAARARIFVDDASWLRDLFHVEPLDMVAAVRRGS